MAHHMIAHVIFVTPDRTKISPVRSGPSPTVRSGQSKPDIVKIATEVEVRAI